MQMDLARQDVFHVAMCMPDTRSQTAVFKSSTPFFCLSLNKIYNEFVFLEKLYNSYVLLNLQSLTNGVHANCVALAIFCKSLARKIEIAKAKRSSR